MREYCFKDGGVNSFVDRLIEGNFAKLKNWAQVKCNLVIQLQAVPKVTTVLIM